MSGDRRHRVLVLGAGISGLSSATRILEACKNADVTIMADKFSPDTCSDGAAGFWECFAFGETDPVLVNTLATETYDYMMALAQSPMAKITGIQQLSGWQTWAKPCVEELMFCNTVDGWRKMTEEELSRVAGAKDGRFFTTMTMDMTPHLKWLTDRLVAKGVRFVKRKINSLNELLGEWDVVVNCSSLGSYDLLQDRELYPIRGQVFRVRAPWVKHFCILDKSDKDGYKLTYILPNFDTIVVGGVFQKGNWNEEAQEEDAMGIWERTTAIMPSLKEATILKTWVGLRPGRDTMRLEPEVMEISPERTPLRVVHNYGHGGAGVSLHWGCARRVTEMVSSFIHDIEKENVTSNSSNNNNNNNNKNASKSKL